MDYEKTAVRVSNVGITANIILTIFKLIAGIASRSGAMVSDAVHSASDAFSSIIVIIGVRFAARDADSEHPYGHERFECIASIVLSVILAMTGLLIGRSALEKLFSQAAGAEAPGLLALLAAVVSILVKETMFQYTARFAKQIDSGALMAEAHHHRSDALSSIGALAGIAGARAGLLFLEPAASLVICVFILKAALDIFRDAADRMVDRACDDETAQAILQTVLAQTGVMGVDSLSTRMFANKIYVDIEITADGSLSLAQGHDIAERVHDAVETAFPKVKHIMVHVNPSH